MIYEEILPNTIKIIHEYVPHTRTISCGIWLREGSRDEPEEKNGILHFIEHMFFKGSKRFGAKEIAKIIDSLGGEIDAFTSKEFMGINFKVLDRNFEKAMELLSDIFLNPLFLQEEMEKEKRVILEEIKSVEDDPEDLSLEFFFRSYFDSHPLGRSVLGKESTVKSLEREDLWNKFSSTFIPSKIFITSSGSMDFEKIKDSVYRHFGHLPYHPNHRDLYPPSIKPGLYLKKKKDLEQVHIVFGLPGVPQKSDKKIPFLILNEIVGGGFSSRLFQKVREEKGLVYNIGSIPTTFLDCGTWTILCSSDKKNIEDVMKIIREELYSIYEGDIIEEEVERAKEHLKGGFVLNLETTTSRMAYLARNELCYGEQISVDSLLQEINKTEISEIKNLAKELIDLKRSAICLLGNLRKIQNIEKLI